MAEHCGPAPSMRPTPRRGYRAVALAIAVVRSVNHCPAHRLRNRLGARGFDFAAGAAGGVASAARVGGPCAGGAACFASDFGKYRAQDSKRSRCWTIKATPPAMRSIAAVRLIGDHSGLLGLAGARVGRAGFACSAGLRTISGRGRDWAREPESGVSTVGDEGPLLS